MSLYDGVELGDTPHNLHSPGQEEKVVRSTAAPMAAPHG
jgi:hypothetical protein